jgi:hypothetical protein
MRGFCSATAKGISKTAVTNLAIGWANGRADASLSARHNDCAGDCHALHLWFHLLPLSCPRVGRPASVRSSVTGMDEIFKAWCIGAIAQSPELSADDLWLSPAS